MALLARVARVERIDEGRRIGAVEFAGVALGKTLVVLGETAVSGVVAVLGAIAGVAMKS